MNIILPPLPNRTRPQDVSPVPCSGEQQRRRMGIDSVLNPDEGIRGSPSTSSVTSERPQLPSWPAINGEFSRKNSIAEIPSWSSINIRSREASSSSDSNPDYNPDYRPLDYSPAGRPYSPPQRGYSPSSRPYSSPSRRYSVSQNDRNNLSHHDRRASSARRERREMRPTYAPEEELFIWYHRDDLGMDWPDVRKAYNTQFPDRPRKGFQGIQCKYYRCCEAHGVPRVRERNRLAGGKQIYGVRSRLPHLWYPWMRANDGKGPGEGARERERNVIDENR